MPDYRHLLDRELVDAGLAARESTAFYTPMTVEKLAHRRAWMDQNALPPLTEVPFERLEIARASGCGDGPPVAAYLANPQPGRSGPAILHMHGGGFTASTALQSLPEVQRTAIALDCPILTVEYRLAPETIWEGSLGDNYSALIWLHEHAAQIGVDRQRIAVMGESAGGGHAALLAIAARDRGEVPIAFQCLTYPMLDDRTGTSRKLAEHLGYYGWNSETNYFGWRAFLGCEPGGDDVPVAAVPARQQDLLKLPPTWIGVGGLDLFVEENLAYAAGLNHAGVSVEALVLPGAFHGSDSFVREADISRRFRAARLDALRRGLRLNCVSH